MDSREIKPESLLQAVDHATRSGSTDLIMWDDQVVFTAYSDSIQQVFYTARGNYIFTKDTQLVYEMTIDAWTKIVLKIASVTDDMDSHFVDPSKITYGRNN